MSNMNGSAKGKPSGCFWMVVVLVVVGLAGFAAFRAFSGGDGASPLSIPGVMTSSSGDILEISFYTSDAKKKWVDEMVKTFNEAGHEADGKVIKVKAVHVLSGSSLEDIKSGKIKPDMWSPGDESWLELGAAHWRNVNQRALFDEYKPLVNVPLVIAMWEPMARALGYPKPIGWRDVEKLAASPAGWAGLGHPEWGKFRWGHAHPDANSGFLTVISEVYAALGKTKGITTEDLKKKEVADFLESFEGAVEHYALSNSWIDDLMHKKGPSYLSAAVQYENTIIESNQKNQNKPFKLVAVYPKEGCLFTRHPVAILKESWMTPEKEEASKKFIEFLLSEDAQRRAMALGLRPIKADLELGAPFIEENGAQAKIATEKAFEVPGEDVLKRIRDLWEDVKVPATIFLVLDRSGSMKGAAMDNAKTGAVQFVKSMKPRDELRVVVFNHLVSDLSPLASVRESGEAAVSKLEGLFAEGGTALYDAANQAYQALLALKKANPRRRYAVMILSDGLDTNSKMKWHEFVDTLPKGEDFDVPKIYTIAYGGEADKNVLAEISNRTNGRLFISNPSEIAKTYKELSANF